MNKQTPRIVMSPLSNRWYVVTRYRVKDGLDAQTGQKHQYIVATTKYDVTDQMGAILSKAARAAVRRGKTQTRVSAPRQEASR